MQTVKEFFQQNDRFAAHSGIELLQVEKGRAVAKMVIGPHHLNSGNVVHGGAIFTLADFAFAAACNSHGRLAFAIQVSIHFIKSAESGTLFAEAKEISLHHRIATYAVEIKDDQGQLIATFQGMVFRKDIELPFAKIPEKIDAE